MLVSPKPAVDKMYNECMEGFDLMDIGQGPIKHETKNESEKVVLGATSGILGATSEYLEHSDGIQLENVPHFD